MSNEPMFGEPMSSELQSNEFRSNDSVAKESAARPAADTTASGEFGADAAQVLAALARMEAAIRGERTALGRLRGALGDMANAIARAKRAMQQSAFKPHARPVDEAFDPAALLDELEHRVDEMIELAGSSPSAGTEPARPASDDQVPTVSGVVSRLGRSENSGAAEHAPDATGVPTVTMLATMVQALSAAAEPSPETQTTPQAIEAAATPVPAAEALPPIAVAAQAVPAFAGDPMMPEADLLASIAELEALPILPPEVGAAVIFDRTQAPEPEAAAEPAAQAAAAPLASAVAEPVAAKPAAKVTVPDVDLDLTAFLFGPDVPPPAAETQPSPEVQSLPAVDLMTVPAVPARDKQIAPPNPPSAPEPAAERRAQVTSGSDPHDPLAPLKAMSAEERIALFS